MPLSGKDYLNALNNTIRFTVGDYSQDGHNQLKQYIIKTNLNSVWIKRAYDEASATLGFCFVNEVATEYEEPFVPEFVYDKLINVFDYDIIKELAPYDDYHKKYVIDDPDNYVELYLMIIGLGEPDFKYEHMKFEGDNINIGGYGIFQP